MQCATYLGIIKNNNVVGWDYGLNLGNITLPRLVRLDICNTVISSADLSSLIAANAPKIQSIRISSIGYGEEKQEIGALNLGSNVLLNALKRLDVSLSNIHVNTFFIASKST